MLQHRDCRGTRLLAAAAEGRRVESAINLHTN